MTKSPNDVVVLSAIRSPITRSFKGGFKDAWPEDILGPIMAEAPRRANIEAKDVQDVLIGNVLAELGFAKTGRMALLNAGFPVTTTFHTVNRQCSSSLQAVTHLAHSIWAGQIDVAMAGGVESMSKNYQTRGVPADVGPSLRGTAIKSAADCLMPMGITSENVASRYKISRQMQDDFALLSHSRANQARSAGHFDSEIVPVEYTFVDGEVESRVRVEADDTIRAGVTLEKLAKLKPAFVETGGSTAGNSSQICDGASAAILARRSWAEARGLKPLARFLGTQVAGCEPDEMGMGPLYAIPRLYKHAGIEQKDVDIFELNEAFASQTLACIHGLGLDIDRVNPNGGAIAIGHPTGATGTRQLATLLAELTRQDKEVGVISMCASTGLGVASAFIREESRTVCSQHLVHSRYHQYSPRRSLNTTSAHQATVSSAKVPAGPNLGNTVSKSRTPQTLTDKIFQRHAVNLPEGKVIRSGDYVQIQPHRCLSHDKTWPIAQKFMSMDATRIKYPKQLVFALDHQVQSKTEANLRKYRLIEEFAKEHGVVFFPAGHGIGHQVMIEELFVWPGTLCVGSDSHSNMYGGIGSLGVALVRSDAASVWATGKSWFQVPPVVQVTLTGTLPPGVTGKDVIVALCGLFPTDVLNHSVEFVGSEQTMSSIPVDDRLTISNMSTEWSSTSAVDHV
ncbi:hypothetical protein FALCPG4_006945 [Fusarium falciforme]